MEVFPESGQLKFTPELQLNVRLVGVAGSSTVTIEGSTGLLFCPVLD